MACGQCTDSKVEDDGCPELTSEQKCSERRSCYQTFLRRTVICKQLIYLVSFVLVLGLTATVANADISDGIMAYWPLDEGTGTTTAGR
jgi:hypothetical protein